MRSIVLSIIIAALFSGCTTYHAKVGEAEITMTYFLQDKDFDSFSFDPNTNTFELSNYGSETSQIVKAAIEAALSKVGAR
jgi:hypothetical protein